MENWKLHNPIRSTNVRNGDITKAIYLGIYGLEELGIAEFCFHFLIEFTFIKKQP